MQLLLIHSDFIEYEVKKSTPVAEKIGDDLKSGRMEDALAAFITVEKPDEANPQYVIDRGVESIVKMAEQVKATRVMLYPYAHLSSNLSSPKTAIEVLTGLEAALKAKNFEVKRSPFGWYKAFTVKCKGHPLSELSRNIVPEGSTINICAGEKPEVVSEAVKNEEKLKSYFYVMDVDGTLKDPKTFDYKGHEKLKAFVDYEMAKKRAVDRVPPHVELMRRLELADYEPGSDPGNMRFYPKGRMVKNLLENYVLMEAAKKGAMEVETPIMYDMEHPTLKKYLDRFPARQYTVIADKKNLFLRFAACFGQFLMSHDMTISYKNLPLKMIELTRYSFRKEQRGELVGLRRLRAFTMPDMHTLCADMAGATSEFRDQYEMCINTLDTIGLTLKDYEVAIRFTRDFYDQNKGFIKGLVKRAGKPVVIEMWDQRFFYFVLKFEFNFIDSLDKASALSTVQIDVENAERYDITYVDQDGSKKYPTILHCSPSGAIERCIYAQLEKQFMESEKGQVPMLPVWLSPTQVRIISLSDRHADYCRRLAGELRPNRVDIDDREETVSKKVRDAGKEWIPYVVTIGDAEIGKDKFPVVVRSESQPNKPLKVEMTVEELKARLAKDTDALPARPLPIAESLAKRPKFVGSI
ncbi:threonyl-tRNA synthetase [Methanocella paludicola SANAE]|uniref:Threonine--tRNA ligase n=1 Tax=Methanocella paludicola (strain DSM 17711 / JCM 13418 / NBRC 101707 / SANAE) TaxID=304371 RepID=D1YVJ6_METPS|nr:threonine--tRNA ligase [Methanocella paludicola]BAI60468.1 threonyl-tRNA synthetase [Methanocella paludicola SANAE]